VIASFHLADVGPRAALRLLRRGLKAGELPGLRYADVLSAAPLRDRALTPPQAGRVGVIAFWERDDALDRFLAGHPLAAGLAGGWHARMQPLRASGSWSELPELSPLHEPVDDDEPVAVITLGRLRLRRLVPFVRANAPAMALAVHDPAVLAATGLARPPGLVATFSLWRTAAEMRAYAYGQNGAGHLAAIRAHRARPFHRESTFIRLRLSAAHGSWDGREPLSAAAQPAVAP
jgi:hypothetical protein